MASSVQPLCAHGHFALRRLHSLCGIFPIGVFLINHMLTNSTALLGSVVGEHFTHHVALIHSLPWLLAIEIVFIFIPLAFHGIYGLIIAMEGRANYASYPYMDNWRYALQRITAYITIVFVVVHLLHFRLAHWLGGPSYADAVHAGQTFAITQDGFLNMLLPTWVWMVIYVIGLSAAVFHFCNGIVTFCITWGIAVSVNSRKRLSWLAGALGLLLLAWGLLSLYAFGTFQRPADNAAPDHHTVAIRTVD